MSNPYSVMVVCTGNICRSPMAEVVLRERFAAAGLGDRVVSTRRASATRSTATRSTAGPARSSSAHGYPAGDGTARGRSRPPIERDLVLAMTNAHARALRRLGAEPVLYRSFDPDAIGDLDVADPWYGGDRDFEDCLAQIEAAADGIVAHVRRDLGNAQVRRDG